MFNYFEYVIPMLKEVYRLIIYALMKYDKDNSDEDFMGAEDVPNKLPKLTTIYKMETENLA